MVNFRNISNNWNAIAHRTVTAPVDPQDDPVVGRAVCFIRTLGTPLKALSGLGRLALSTAEIATIVLGVVTLNKHPKELGQAIVNLIDIPVGAVLLPVALTAHVVRGLAGTIYHPSVMIKYDPQYDSKSFYPKAPQLIFKNTFTNWYKITNRTVYSINGAHQASSLEGRFICLMHTLGTPLKALSGLGRLALTIADTAIIILGVVTLNKHPKELGQVIVNIIDMPVGAVLLPIALTVDVIRGIVGTIFHPGAMIRKVETFAAKNEIAFFFKHNILQGTLVYYPV